MSATKFLVSLLATFVTLLVLWCAAGSAHAATYQETCRRVPLLQAARPRETVEVCELHRVANTVVASTTRARTGRTTVVHYGHRAPTYTITYVAQR